MISEQISSDSAVRYLAFDLGAESSRAIVGTLRDGRFGLEELHRFPTRNVSVRGTRHWDILFIIAEIKEALRQYALRHGPRLSGIGVDTWGVDFGLIGPSGQLLQNPVQYRDHRTDGILERAFRVVPREALYERTGLQFMPINTLYQLWALRATAPEVLRAAQTLLMVPDLLNYFLTGQARGEQTIASTTQMLNVRRRRWSRSLLRAFSLPADILPPLVEPGSKLGMLDAEIQREAGLDPTPVFAVCAHDTASAVAGVPAQGEGWGYISCGTWSVLGVELTEPQTGPAALEHNFTNEGGLGGTIRFLKNIAGLWVLQQCRAAWERRGQSHDYAELTDMARSAPPFQTLLNIDAPIFFNSPDMVEAVAAHCRQTGQAAPAGIGATARAILEGLALRYAVVLGELESVIGRRLDRVHMVGGGIRNELLCQMAADAMDRPVVAGPVEATALGNLMVQAMADGRIADHAAGRRAVADSTPLKMYEPRSAADWRPVMERYVKLMKIEKED